MKSPERGSFHCSAVPRIMSGARLARPQADSALATAQAWRALSKCPTVNQALSRRTREASSPSHIPYIQDIAPPGTVTLEEGATVVGSDGDEIGDVEEFFTDPREDRATQILLSEGLNLSRHWMARRSSAGGHGADRRWRPAPDRSPLRLGLQIAASTGASGLNWTPCRAGSALRARRRCSGPDDGTWPAPFPHSPLSPTTLPAPVPAARDRKRNSVPKVVVLAR